LKPFLIRHSDYASPMATTFAAFSEHLPTHPPTQTLQRYPQSTSSPC
jgi:hypothetical protein